MKSIEHKFEVGQEVYLLTHAKDEVIPVRVHMVRAEWSPYGFILQYDVYPTKAGRYIHMGDFLQQISEEYLFATEDKARAQMKSKREIAKDALRYMKLIDCVEYWNKKNCDLYCRLNGINKMEDEDRWDEIATEIGAWTFYRQLSLSDKFNDSDKYFGYIHDSCEFFSFSTKQEMMALLEDWFVDELEADLEQNN